MHSRIITLDNENMYDEDDLFEMMPRGVDYVSEMDLGSHVQDLKEFLERIGTVDDDMVLHIDFDKVRHELEALYDEYEKCQIECFSDFADSHKAWRAKAYIEDEYGVRIYSDWGGMDTWAGFLRTVYKHRNDEWRKDVERWEVDGLFDYHY